MQDWKYPAQLMYINLCRVAGYDNNIILLLLDHWILYFSCWWDAVAISLSVCSSSVISSTHASIPSMLVPEMRPTDSCLSPALIRCTACMLKLAPPTWYGTESGLLLEWVIRPKMPRPPYHLISSAHNNQRTRLQPTKGQILRSQQMASSVVERQEEVRFW